MTAKKRKTPQERRLSAQQQLEQAKKPINSLAAWEAEEHLRDIAEGRA